MGELARVAYETVAKDQLWDMLPLLMANRNTGDIISVNRFVAAMFGYEIEELIGQKVEILVPTASRLLHATYRQEVQAPEMRLMGKGRLLAGQKKDGTLIPVTVGIKTFQCMGDTIAIASIMDLTGLVDLPKPISEVPQ